MFRVTATLAWPNVFATIKIACLNDNTLIGDVSASYFAENIRAMLTEYEAETIDNSSPLSLSVVNLENMRTYKTGYFIMCEAGKYPRPYIEQFPYTEDLCKILADEKFGIKALPSNRFGLKYHLKLEKYLLKNVLDFISDELVITYAEKESGAGNTISVFARSIAALFGTEISFESNRVEKTDCTDSHNDKKVTVYLPSKSNYTVTELALFKLCPRMYYHYRSETSSCFSSRLQLHFYAEAVLYCDLLRRFMDYNLQNKAVYSVKKDEYRDTVIRLHKECVDENRVFFGFMSDYEWSDASRNVLSKIMSSIENSKEYIKGKTFTLIS